MSAAARHPNLIVLMADQLRPDVLGCYGAPYGASPHIDGLAEQSVVFGRHLTNCPLCVPARCSLATGTYPHVNGAMINGWGGPEAIYGTCRKEYGTFYESLAKARYRVEHWGVDHLECEPPIDRRGEGIAFLGGKGEHSRWLKQRGLHVDLSPCKSPTLDYENGRAIVMEYTNPNTMLWPHAAEDFFDSWLSRQVAEQIEQADAAKPLALTVNFWLPHCPLSCPEPFFSRFDPARLQLPENVGRWYPGQSPLHMMNLPGHVAASTTIDGWRRAWAVYLGMVSLLDDCVGHVLAAWKRKGWFEDSVILLTADHGEMLGSHRMFQKMCMYEEAVRVPLLVKAPGASKGQRPQLTQHLDLAATICDLCGAEAMPTNQGRSLRNLLQDGRAEGCREVFMEYNGNHGRSFQQRAVVTERYKYINNHGYEDELYDLAADPMETDNLCRGGQEHPQVRLLREKLRDWMTRTNDCLPPPVV